MYYLALLLAKSKGYDGPSSVAKPCKGIEIFIYRIFAEAGRRRREEPCIGFGLLILEGQSLVVEPMGSQLRSPSSPSPKM